MVGAWSHALIFTFSRANFHFQAHLGLKESPTNGIGINTFSEDTVLSWEPGNEAKTTLSKQPIEILSNWDLLHNMKITLDNLVGHNTDYLISCSIGVLFAACSPTRLMSIPGATCLDPVHAEPIFPPHTQYTHHNLWCHHVKLGELSESRPTMRSQKTAACWSAFSNRDIKCILNSKEVSLCKLPQAQCRRFQWPLVAQS